MAQLQLLGTPSVRRSDCVDTHTGGNMIDVMFGSLWTMLTSPHIMGLMLLGVMIGLIVGVTPGIGGRLSIALAIPFVFGMDKVAGAVFLLTMHAVNGTSGQISSIMFGVPGEGRQGSVGEGRETRPSA